MLKFEVITIFPNIFRGFLEESLLKKAQEKGLIKIAIYDLRNWAVNKQKSIDDRPYGGGRGMIFKVEPIFRAISDLAKFKIQPRTKKIKLLRGKKEDKKSKIILFTPRGKKFNQAIAYQFSKLDRLIMLCGRYEGVDERVAKYIADIELSIGDYVLMGGEVAAMAVIESTTRLIPGVIGKSELLSERMLKSDKKAIQGFIEYPQYTRPAVFFPKKRISWEVPKVLLSGHHKNIEKWRRIHQKII